MEIADLRPLFIKSFKIALLLSPILIIYYKIRGAMDKENIILGFVISSGLALLIFTIMSQVTVDKSGGYFYWIIFILLNIYFHVAINSGKSR